jgi:hypothetical protein
LKNKRERKKLELKEIKEGEKKGYLLKFKENGLLPTSLGSLGSVRLGEEFIFPWLMVAAACPVSGPGHRLDEFVPLRLMVATAALGRPSRLGDKIVVRSGHQIGQV